VNPSAQLVRFARVLRAAGIPVGTDRVVDAHRAVEAVGVRRRDDLYCALAALFVSRHEHYAVFDEAFAAVWGAAAVGLPGTEPDTTRVRADTGVSQRLLSERVSAALGAGQDDAACEDAPPELREDASLTASAQERLRQADFSGMTAAELAEVKRMLARLRLPIHDVPSRRLAPQAHGRRIDLRRSIQASLRAGADVIPLHRCGPRRVRPPLVVLCDISGSMERYARMFLQFLHAVTNDRDRVQVFVFGTRLTNVTRQLRHRDVDVALAAVAAAIADWSGGTRIGESLRAFNLRWSRRVLGQNASVMLISDGLERGDATLLAEEAARLRRACRRLIWLNPLLRFDGFEPLAAGIRALLPQADAFLPAHNLNSLTGIAEALSRKPVADHSRRHETWKSTASS
jgi:uncharacterized protein with von Willebrand factor type A (vWA) domain